MVLSLKIYKKGGGGSFFSFSLKKRKKCGKKDSSHFFFIVVVEVVDTDETETEKKLRGKKRHVSTLNQKCRSDPTTMPLETETPMPTKESARPGLLPTGRG